METIGQRLARVRKEKGLSQAELAKLAGFSGQGGIGNIERDIRGYGARIIDIARALDTTPEYLRTGDLAAAQSDQSDQVNHVAISVTTQQALDALSETLEKLPPLVQSAGRDALKKWAQGEASNAQTEAVLRALTTAGAKLPPLGQALVDTPVKQSTTNT